MPDEDARAPVLYVTDLGFDLDRPADLFDIAWLLRSPEHDLRGVVLTRPDHDGERVLDALTTRANQNVPVFHGLGGLRDALEAADTPLSVVVVGGFATVAALLDEDRARFRAKVARLFLVGGTANDYGDAAATTTRLPINPRLRELHPERFTNTGGAAFGRLLTSGEGVIWVPGDVSLWRYAAPGVLEDGGPVAAFLLRELFFWNLRAGGAEADRYDRAEAPVLLSAAPAFLLARTPDPFAWMRLFRAVAARAETDGAGNVTSLSTRTESPNLYVVAAVDGQALGKLVTAGLRDRALSER